MPVRPHDAGEGHIPVLPWLLADEMGETAGTADAGSGALGMTVRAKSLTKVVGLHIPLLR
jgi:hypothetical protein